jgi:hypothetical protein
MPVLSTIPCCIAFRGQHYLVLNRLRLALSREGLFPGSVLATQCEDTTGFYGAAISVYSHFLARGRDVVYPRDMSMAIELGMTENPAAEALPSTRAAR